MSDLFAVVPPEVAEALRRMRDDLGRAAGSNLAGLILYGGLARGRYRAGQSDVNVVVLLHDVSAPSLAAVAPALQAARRAAAVEPMLLTPGEVPAAAVSFPTKFLDIREHHVVLAGADPFANLDVPREAVRQRVAQQLRNLALRIRRRYLTAVDKPDAQTAALAGIARPLALETAVLLRLADKPLPAEDRTAAIFEAAAVAFDLDRDALARLAALRQEPGAKLDPSELFANVLAIATRLAERAEQLT
jgi:hypothetical protein